MNVQSLIHRVFKSNMSDSEKLEWLRDLHGIDYESSIAENSDDVQHQPERSLEPLVALSSDMMTSREIAALIGYSDANLSLWNQQRPDLFRRQKTRRNGTLTYLYSWAGVQEFMRLTGRVKKDGKTRRRVQSLHPRIKVGQSSETHSNVEIRDWYTIAWAAQLLKVSKSSVEEIMDRLTVYQISDMKIVNIQQVSAVLSGSDLPVDKSVWKRWGLLTHIGDVYQIDHHSLSRARESGRLASHYISAARCVLCIPEVEQKYRQDSSNGG